MNFNLTFNQSTDLLIKMKSASAFLERFSVINLVQTC